jgi:hypothetical protein
MDFKDLKGVGDSTAEKLRKADYTLENIMEIPAEKITKKTGLPLKVVENILLEAGKKDDPPQPEIDPEVPLDEPEEDPLKGENRYLVRAFKKSRHYKTPLSNKGLRESFNEYKKIGVEKK